MKILTEKQKFSERFKIALAQNEAKPLKTSEIATQFNLLYQGEGVTQQAVHKWLTGQAMPAMDKIETLAKWLNVKPEWLRYGVVEESANVSALNEVLMNLIQPLSEQQKLALVKMITAFTQEKTPK